MKAKYIQNFICILSSLAFLLIGCESSAPTINDAKAENTQEIEEANNEAPQNDLVSGNNNDFVQPVDVAENTETENNENWNNTTQFSNDPHENLLKQYEDKIAGGESERGSYVEHLIITARKKMAQHKYKMAKTFLDQALALDSGHPEANKLRNEVGVFLGERRLKQENYLDKFATEEKVKIQQAKLEAKNHYDRGTTYLKDNDYDSAINSFTSSLEIINYVPYELNMQGLRRLSEERITEAKNKKDAMTSTLQKKRMNDARAEALRIEEEQQARQSTEIRLLLTRAGEFYINKKYSKAEQLVKEVKEKDPLNKIAKRLEEDINDARNDYISQTTNSKRIEEWKTLLEGFREASIPYMDDLQYTPDKDWWHNVVSKREENSSLSRNNSESELSEAEREINEKLNTGTITLNFNNIPFREVILYIKETADINIVIDQKVLQNFQIEDKKVDNLNLENIKLKTALNVLMRFYDLVYIFRNDVLFITSKDSELAKGKSVPVLHPIQDLTAEIADFPGPRVVLENTSGDADNASGVSFDEEESGGSPITGEKLTDLIKASIAPDSWDKPANSIDITNGQLLVVNTEEIQNEIRKFLLDMRRFSGMMVAIETRFLDVSDDFLEVLGVDWRGIGDTQINGNNDPNIPDDDNVVPITGVVRGAEDFAGNPNINPDNIFTTALNGSVNTAAGFFFQESVDLRARTENVDEQQLGKRLFDNGGLALEFSFLDDLEMNAVLRAVKKTHRQEVLFAPRITTFNTQRAHISIVKQLSFVKDFDVEVAQSAYIADPVIGTIQSGLVLDVRPTISNDRRYITLEMRPTFADLVGGVFDEIDTTLGGIGVVTIQVPVLELQSVETTVRIPDQGTVMLGGFKEINQQDHKQDIPILGNIPIISFFFSQRRKIDEKRQIIILVKAKIIDLEEREELSVGRPR